MMIIYVDPCFYGSLQTIYLDRGVPCLSVCFVKPTTDEQISLYTNFCYPNFDYTEYPKVICG